MASLQSHNFVEACKRTGWQIRQYIVWNKNTFTLGRQDYQWKHELCLYGWEEGAGHYFIDDRKLSTVLKDKTEIEPRKMKKDELVNLVEEMLSDNIATTVMDEDKPMRSEEHPTMKPLKLMGRLIKNSTRQGEAVLDMFGGSGSTLIACEQLGRKCYMMELDEHYTDVIIERWEQFTGKKAILIERDERK